EGTTRSISLRASLVIELGALVQLLHALDAHRPNLSIDLVEVRATPGHAAVTMVVAAPKAIGPLLAVDLRLSAVATVGPE
ncbi:MAG: hypothetical protein GY788_05760, partial [bacterium]|nr:hypothetical protein [bacterium]